AARSLALEISCRFQRAGSKYAAVFGAVAQADTFRRAKEANFVLPGYRSTAERMNADFVMLALAVAASPAQLRIPRFVIGIFDGVKEQQRRTAGGVHLAVVVRLHNLYVKSLAQNLGGLLAQVAEQRHAHAHVGGTEYGDLPGGLVHLLLLL